MGITDYFDGYLARAQGAVSRLGIFLDPIADKVMVAAVIVMLVAFDSVALGQPLVKGAQRGGGAHHPAAPRSWCPACASSSAGLQVSDAGFCKLAKWKTTFQLVSLGAIILGGAVPAPALGA